MAAPPRSQLPPARPGDVAAHRACSHGSIRIPHQQRRSGQADFWRSCSQPGATETPQARGTRKNRRKRGETEGLSRLRGKWRFQVNDGKSKAPHAGRVAGHPRQFPRWRPTLPSPLAPPSNTYRAEYSSRSCTSQNYWYLNFVGDCLDNPTKVPRMLSFATASSRPCPGDVDFSLQCQATESDVQGRSRNARRTKSGPALGAAQTWRNGRPIPQRHSRRCPTLPFPDHGITAVSLPIVFVARRHSCQGRGATTACSDTTPRSAPASWAGGSGRRGASY